MADNERGDVCPECDEEFWPEVEGQERCEYCEAKRHEHYQHAWH